MPVGAKDRSASVEDSETSAPASTPASASGICEKNQDRTGHDRTQPKDGRTDGRTQQKPAFDLIWVEDCRAGREELRNRLSARSERSRSEEREQPSQSHTQGVGYRHRCKRKTRAVCQTDALSMAYALS